MAHSKSADIRVVILAGGRGARLRPLTAVFPKPLVPLGNKPILEILLRRLAGFGLTNITLCTGHLSEVLMAVFGDGGKLKPLRFMWGLKVVRVRQVTYCWDSFEGEERVHHFVVSDGADLYQLSYRSKKLIWILEAVEEAS